MHHLALAALALAFLLPGRASAQELSFGREMVLQRRFEDAEAAYQEMLDTDPASLEARLGLLRTGIALGRAAEVLGEVDGLVQEGTGTRADHAYLRGWALFTMARRAVETRTDGPLTSSQFEDAWRQLEIAVDEGGETYGDAWLPLAEAAWYTQELRKADQAAKMAQRFHRGDVVLYLVWGRIRFSLYAVAVAEGKDEETLDGMWSGTRECFQLALQLLYGTSDWKRQAQAHEQLGHLHGWKEELEEASAAYSTSLGMDPDVADPAQVSRFLGSQQFLACIEEALLQFRGRFGEEDPRAATLLWWRGHAQENLGELEAAIASYEHAGELWPDYRDTWFHRFRCLLELGRTAEAASTLARLRELDSPLLDQLVLADEELLVRVRARAAKDPEDADLARIVELLGG